MTNMTMRSSRIAVQFRVDVDLDRSRAGYKEQPRMTGEWQGAAQPTVCTGYS